MSRATDSQMSSLNLYSNLGGVSYAMQKCGWNVVAGVEPKELYGNIYRENFDDHSFIHRPDMSEVDLDILPSTDVDWVHGSPPCRGFTPNNVNSRSDHELNDDTYFFVKWVNELQPLVFTFENVESMTNKLDVDDYVELFDGYDVAWECHDIAKYGIPQHRDRLTIVGVRDGDATIPQPTGETMTSIEALEPEPVDATGHVKTNHSDDKVEQLRRWPYASFRNPSYSRPRPDQPSMTITTSAPIHPTKPRSMTPREMARLQTYDDEFKLVGKKSEMKKIGTTVPQKFVEILSDHVQSYL